MFDVSVAQNVCWGWHSVEQYVSGRCSVDERLLTSVWWQIIVISLVCEYTT